MFSSGQASGPVGRSFLMLIIGCVLCSAVGSNDASCLPEITERLSRVEERLSKVEEQVIEKGIRMQSSDVDMSLLEIFSASSRSIILSKLAPNTDVECDWDWSTRRCEPCNICDLKLKLGDYTLGRGCRKTNETKETCTSNSEPAVVGQQATQGMRRLGSLLQHKIEGVISNFIYPT